jgi:PleD family two-component response regulator
MDRDVIAASRILILDDQEANVLLLERLLQHAGYKNYLSLTDSRQLLDQFRLFQPDLILLDLMMPKLDGYAVMKQLGGWLPSGEYFPILVITADISRATRQKALAAGAKDFLTKPIDAAEAMQRVYNLLLTRWLFRQMDLRKKRCMDQAGDSAKRIAAAMRELDQLAATEPRLSDNMTLLRVELRRAFEAMAKLAGDGDVEPPAPPLKVAAAGGFEQAG